MVQVLLRYILTMFGLYSILFYVLTSPNGVTAVSQEPYMDKIMNFTALIIIIDLDNLLVGQLRYNFFGVNDTHPSERHM